MKLMSERVEHKRVRAPSDNYGTLIDPPLSAAAELISNNVAATANHEYDVQGRSLRRLAIEAREGLLQAALSYTREYRDVESPTIRSSTALLLAGHQPQLFHPGVWFKNFVLGAIARRHTAVAINLIVDSDTIKTASIRVPGGTARDPYVERVPLDRQTAEIPFEERAIVDGPCFRSFGQRAADVIGPLVAQPLVREFWSLATARQEQGRNLGQCIAQARHQQEARWGGSTLELPQSQVCSLPAFHWFACHLLAQLPRLHADYNRAVSDYRRLNHVRSTAHPVPDLAVEDHWLEAPFWIWDRDNPRRRRLFVRRGSQEIVLSDRQRIEYPLALTAEGDASSASQQLADLARLGIRLRTRALITTLFARLFLGDAFLHGIGGAKYDHVTDALIEQFFGLKPPGYMTLTATLRLPIALDDVTAADARRVNYLLRELAYHPERSIDASDDAAADALVREKNCWIATAPTPSNAKDRCRKIHEVNDRLQPWVAQERRSLLEERERITAAERVQGVLASRDYAFCLFPAETLRPLMEIPAGFDRPDRA